MKTAYSFLRWSTKIQGLEGKDSRVRQTDSAKEWITKHGDGQYVLSDKPFVGDGESAYSGKHLALDEYGKAKGALARFIEEVETGKIARDSVLLIDDFSRFSRLEPTQALSLFSNVMSSGIGLVFTSSHEKNVIDNQYLKKHPHVLYFIIGELIRSFTESEEKSRKIKAGKQTQLKNIKNGVIHRNNLPKFFTFVPDVPTNPKCNVGKYVHNDLTEVLKTLIKMFLEGKAMYSIAAELNKRGVQTFKGREWSGNGINKILRNRILFGEYKGVKNYAEPVVTENVFNKIQTILNQNTFNKGKKGGLINIFRGICFCSDSKCKSHMGIMSTAHNGNTYRYLRCNSIARGKKGCSNRSSVSLPEIELEFFTNFLFKNPAQLINDGESKEVKQLKDSIAVNQIKLNNLTAQIKTLVALSKKMQAEEIDSELDATLKERETTKGEIDRQNLMLSRVVDSPEVFKDLQRLVLDAKHTQSKFDELVFDGNPTIDPAEWTKVSSANKKAFSELARTKEQIAKSLQDGFTREGVRIMLPSLIGKITVDTMKGQFYVWNRMGKMIFESQVYESKRNCTAYWRESLKRTKAVQ